MNRIGDPRQAAPTQRSVFLRSDAALLPRDGDVVLKAAGAWFAFEGSICTSGEGAVKNPHTPIEEFSEGETMRPERGQREHYGRTGVCGSIVERTVSKRMNGGRPLRSQPAQLTSKGSTPKLSDAIGTPAAWLVTTDDAGSFAPTTQRIHSVAPATPR